MVIYNKSFNHVTYLDTNYVQVIVEQVLAHYLLQQSLLKVDFLFAYQISTPMSFHQEVEWDTYQWPFQRETNLTTKYRFVRNNEYLVIFLAENVNV